MLRAYGGFVPWLGARGHFYREPRRKILCELKRHYQQKSGAHHSRQGGLGGIGEKGIATYLVGANPLVMLMPKSRGRKPKKKRALASAPKKQLDKTAPQELPLSTQPPREPPLATAPRQEQPTPKIKRIAKLTTAVVLAAIAIVLCAYAFILMKR